MADLELCNCVGQNELQTNLDNMFPFDIFKFTSYYLPIHPLHLDYEDLKGLFIQRVCLLYLKEK